MNGTGSTEAPKILVVDDDEVNVELISQILLLEGYEVRKALGGKMA